MRQIVNLIKQRFGDNSTIIVIENEVVKEVVVGILVESGRCAVANALCSRTRCWLLGELSDAANDIQYSLLSGAAISLVSMPGLDF